jgi:hypothetical protein
MEFPADKVEAVKRKCADVIRRHPGSSGFEVQLDRVLILTNGMTSESKSAIRKELNDFIRELLGYVMPIEFYEIGPIKAQTVAAAPNHLLRK